MSSIFGIYNCQDQRVDKEALLGVLEQLNHWSADKVGLYQNENLGLGHLMLYNTPESLEELLPRQALSGDLIVTSDARIDNRKELIRTLDLARTTKRSLTDSELILSAYRKWGTDCPKYLIGAFSFAIYDRVKNHLFCARDHIGVHPFYYVHANGIFAFASEERGFFGMKNFKPSISPYAIVDLLGHIRSDFGTFYEGIRRLPPAHSLVVKKCGNMEFKKYWTPPIKVVHKLTDPKEYVEEFRDILEEAVNCRMRSHYPIGAQLSGGLDSSGIVAMASKQSQLDDAPLYTYAFCMGEEEKKNIWPFGDDEDLISRVVDHLELNNHTAITSSNRSFLEEIKHTVRTQLSPTSNLQFVFIDRVCHRAKSQNVRTILSGFLGDEIVTSKCSGYLLNYLKELKWRKLRLELRAQNRSIYYWLPRLITSYFFGRAEAKYSVRRRLNKEIIPLQQDLLDQWLEYYMDHKLSSQGSTSFSNDKLLESIRRPVVKRLRCLPECGRCNVDFL